MHKTSTMLSNLAAAVFKRCLNIISNFLLSVFNGKLDTEDAPLLVIFPVKCLCKDEK